MNKDFCVVFVCNKAYFNKFISTCSQLLTKGRYNGNICLIIGDDLHNNELLNHQLITDNNIIVKYFPNIQFSTDFHAINNKIKSDGRNLTKKFQWHKMHLFNSYFKQWNYIFYLDCGMNVIDDISPIINEITDNTLLAHSDAYPSYQWKLHTQFDAEKTEYFTKLNAKYDLNIDYFQTGIMLYDTKIIEPDTYTNLIRLAEEYPISRTNEQGIMNLYFHCEKNSWKQIKLRNENTNFYDYWCRNKTDTKYIIVKVKNW
jgi:hypothetical protein